MPTRRNSQNSREFRELSIQNLQRSRGIHVVRQVGGRRGRREGRGMREEEGRRGKERKDDGRGGKES